MTAAEDLVQRAAPEELPSVRGGRYAILRTLGQGSQGDTLEALDKRDGRVVAIKRFNVRGASSWKDVELAEREAQVLSTLKHPNLPVYIEHFEEGGSLYLVMEKIEGEDLATALRRGARFSREEIVRFLAEAGDALEYLHTRAPPVFHRDIKPANVIRRPDGSFALVDFGSVRAGLKPQGGSTVVGTFGFMAPEQFQGRALSVSDVYSVGATALTLFTGQEPENLPHKGLAIDVAQALGWQEPLIPALSAMLNPDPDRRATRIRPLLGAVGQPRWHDQAWHQQAWHHQAWHHQAGAWHQQRENAPNAWHARRQTRRERRAVRRSRSRHPFGPFWALRRPPLLIVMLVGLAIARFSTWALFGAFLPTLLSALSLVFGEPLERAAHVCRRVGYDGQRGLSVAQDWLLQGDAPPGVTPRGGRSTEPRAGARESTAQKVRVEPGATPEDEMEASLEAEIDALGDALAAQADALGERLEGRASKRRHRGGRRS